MKQLRPRTSSRPSSGRVPIPALLTALVGLAAVLYLLLEDPSRDSFDPDTKPAIQETGAGTPVQLAEPATLVSPVDQGSGRTEVVHAGTPIAGTISGRVVTPDKEALPGARVIVTEQPDPRSGRALLRQRGVTSYEVTTSARGNFALRDLDLGKTFDLWIHHEDYCLTQQAPIVPIQGESQDLGDLVIDNGREIYGLVTDRNGNPIPEATLEAKVQSTANSWLPDLQGREADLEVGRLVIGETDDEGEFSLTKLPQGIWTLVVSAEGFGTAQVGPISLNNDSEDQRRSRQHIELGPEHFLSGFVYDEEGRPIVDARVTVGRVRPRPAIQKTTASAEDGGFELRGLPDGHYGVYVAKEGFENQNRNGVKVDGEPLKIVMYKKGGVTGRVTDLDGRPITRFRVDLKKVNRGTPMFGPTSVGRSYESPDGNYSLENVDKGTYRLLVQADGFAPTYSPGFRVDREIEYGVDVRMSRGATITGSVSSLADGTPIEGAEIILHGLDFDPDRSILNFFGSEAADPNNVPRQVVRTGPDGRFVLSHAYVGYAQFRGTADVKVEARHPEYLSEFTTLTLEEGIEVDIGPLELRRGASIKGVALDAEGAPLSGGTVYLNRAQAPGSGYFSQNVTLDSNGRFRFTGLEAGRYELTPVEASRTNGFLLDMERGKQDVFVREGEVREITLRLPPPGGDAFGH